MIDSDLEAIVYVSSAVRLFSLEEVAHLLQRARERNEDYGVTGVLLYHGGNFMQYIEGPKDSLDVIYDIIKKDDKHTGIIVVSREVIERRQFDDWSMAFQSREFEGYVGSPGESMLGDMLLGLPDDNATSARVVLHGFWSRSGSQKGLAKR